MSKLLKQNRNKVVGPPGIEPGTPTVSRQKAAYQGVRQSRSETLAPSRKYVIPAGFSLIPGIEWRNGRATMFHILCEDVIAGSGKGVETKRRTKGGR